MCECQTIELPLPVPVPLPVPDKLNREQAEAQARKLSLHILIKNAPCPRSIGKGVIPWAAARIAGIVIIPRVSIVVIRVGINRCFPITSTLLLRRAWRLAEK